MPPQTHAVDAELADHAPRADLAVAEDGVAEGRGPDELHEDVGAPFALVGAERGQEGGDLGPVDVVPSALALRLEHVRGRARGFGGERDGMLPCGSAVERIDGGKGLADAMEEGGGRG